MNRQSQIKNKESDVPLTPLDEGYASCAETNASLIIYPNEMVHEEVTALLGIEPTKAVNSGDTRESSLGVSSIVRMTMWKLTSEGQVDSKDLRHHLHWLLEQIGLAGDSLLSMREKGQAEMAITCRWWSENNHGGPALLASQMYCIGEMGLEMNFEFQFLDEE